MSNAIHPTILAFLEAPDGRLLREDLAAWSRWRAKPYDTVEARAVSLAWHLRSLAEFRSLFDYRVRQADAAGLRELSPALPRAHNLYISTPEIGGGIRIQHGHGAWILAERIGRNLLINQHCTIGVARGGKPVIGDNVSIRTGAIVVGPITIGDGVTIGPNAVVDFDVPAGAKVFAQRPHVILRSKEARAESVA